MASSKEFLLFITDQLSPLGEITYRPMMGEYLLYYRGKLFGGIYDDRLLLKPCQATQQLLPSAKSALPYDGAKPMTLVEDTDDRELLCELIAKMYEDLPQPRSKK